MLFDRTRSTTTGDATQRLCSEGCCRRGGHVYRPIGDVARRRESSLKSRSRRYLSGRGSWRPPATFPPAPHYVLRSSRPERDRLEPFLDRPRTSGRFNVRRGRQSRASGGGEGHRNGGGRTTAPRSSPEGLAVGRGETALGRLQSRNSRSSAPPPLAMLPSGGSRRIKGSSRAQGSTGVKRHAARLAGASSWYPNKM